MQTQHNSILQLLANIRPEANFNSSKNFVDEGLLDSFDLVVLVSTLEKEFSVSIPGTDIVPENFSSVEGILQLLARIGADVSAGR